MELRVSAFLGDPSRVQDEDAVRNRRERQAVGDADRRASQGGDL
jgi:hypothetical protein